MHFNSNVRGFGIKCTAKDVRKAEHIVNLVRVIASSCCHDNILTSFIGQLGQDFRVRIGKCEHNRMVCHGCQHFSAEYVWAGNSDKYIGCLHCIVQRAFFSYPGESLFIPIKVFTFTLNNTFTVYQGDIVLVGPQ